MIGLCFANLVMIFPEDLHLSPVSAVVQLHPQLHHLDAMDEVPAKGRGKGRKEGDEERPGENEARAIDVKIKAAEDGEAAMVAGNLELLKKMQDEKWHTYDWVDAEVSISLPCSRYAFLLTPACRSTRPRSRGRHTKAV